MMAGHWWVCRKGIGGASRELRRVGLAILILGPQKTFNQRRCTIAHYKNGKRITPQKTETVKTISPKV